MLQADDCRDPDLLSQLDRDKAQIILNENCAIHCPNRAKHYDVYARWQRLAVAESMPITLNSISPMAEVQLLMEELRQRDAACQSPVDLKSLLKGTRNCNLTPPEMKAIYDLGFRHFKLQGRGDVADYYAYDLTRILLEPNLAAPTVFKALLSSICTRIVPS